MATEIQSAPERVAPPRVAPQPAAKFVRPATETVASAPRTSGSLFRVIWRWHFYAGISVAPFLMVMAITGGVYIFKAEIAHAIYAERLYVEPAGERVSFQAQIDAAVAAVPGAKPANLTILPEADRSAIVSLTPAGPKGEKGAKKKGGRRNGTTVFVNPYSAEVVGVQSGPDKVDAFFSFILKIHRQLFIGTTGRVITELCTAWSIVLMVTGLYLWWPRNWSNVRGVWLPRLQAKRYTALRDLHALAGVYLLPIALIIAVTGMFYTLVVGTGVHEGAKYITSGAAATSSSRGQDEAEESAAEQSLSIDELVAIAKREYPERILYVPLAAEETDGTITFGAGNDWENSYGPYLSTQVKLNRKDGVILAKTHSSDGEWFWHGWTYPLHVGSIFGPTTKTLWLAACLVLTAMPVTGIWMWWMRRPEGQTGFPRRPEVRIPWKLRGAIAVLCLLFPVFGASVVLLLVGEKCVALLRGRGNTAAAGT